MGSIEDPGDAVMGALRGMEDIEVMVKEQDELPSEGVLVQIYACNSEWLK